VAPVSTSVVSLGAVHVIDYHHVIAALRAKPGALANLA
jgi:hypothetical protein